MNVITEKLKERLGNLKINKREGIVDELREITQELVLVGLAKSGIFNKATFQGGTALRLLYKIKRYSEDLDFVLDKPDNNFIWKPYLDTIKDFVGNYGCSFEISDKSKLDNSVKKAFVKDYSIEQMMNFSWTMKTGTPQKISIKLEMDSKPPLYSECEILKHNFPYEYDIKVQKISSLFAGKCHALLCREYDKGRDWFDFKYFIKNSIEPNYKYLESMLEQQGFYKDLVKNKHIEINKTWLCNELTKKVDNIDINIINEDISNFTKNNPDYNIQKKDIYKLIDFMKSDKYGIINKISKKLDKY